MKQLSKKIAGRVRYMFMECILKYNTGLYMDTDMRHKGYMFRISLGHARREPYGRGRESNYTRDMSLQIARQTTFLGFYHSKNYDDNISMFMKYDSQKQEVVLYRDFDLSLPEELRGVARLVYKEVVDTVNSYLPYARVTEKKGLCNERFSL